MDYWQIVMIAVFVTSLILVLYYWCKYVFQRTKTRSRRVLESRQNNNSNQSPSVYSITTVVLENSSRPRRPSTREPSLDLPPSYAEAVQQPQPV